MRADQLSRRGLAATRSQAQRLIAAACAWHDARGLAPSPRTATSCPRRRELELLDTAEARYVSRGGLKLEGALAASGLDVAGCAASTSASPPAASPTACCSTAPRRWWASTSATASCMPSCASDERVVAIEGVNARDSMPDARSRQVADRRDLA
jgi:23S rRNA (cytidine1920-2'-O)/16S rRNA (cytidine1409-2'-O)-methyltransferase